jgi:tetratricopeptide (TPR) repeat protein
LGVEDDSVQTEENLRRGAGEMLKRLGCFLIVAILIWSTPAFGQVTRQDLVTLQKAQTLLKAKKYKAAIKMIEDLLKQVPRLTEGHRLLGHAYFDSGQLVKARGSFVTAFQQGCLEADVLGRLAKLDQDAKRFPSLINILRLLMISQPGEQSWRILYGDVLLLMGELDEAQALYSQLIESNPTRKDFYLRLGNLALQRGQLKEAATSFETAYHLGEMGKRLPGTIAGLWYELERWRDALAWYDRAALLEPGKSGGYSLKRARLLIRIGESKRAEVALRRLSVGKDKELGKTASLLLGQIAQRTGRIDEAVSHWERAFKSGYRERKLLKFLGLHFFKAKDYKQAKSYLKLLASTGDTSDALVLRALIAAQLRTGDENDARSQLEGYLEHHGLDKAAQALIREMARR